MDQRLILFDFDGTITSADSLQEFITFCFGRKALLKGTIKLLPVLMLHAAGIINAQRTKEHILKHFFAGTRLDDFNNWCHRFVTIRLPSILRPKALRSLNLHIHAGDVVIVVSASPENWIAPWCLAQGVGCIATRLEMKDGVITGRIEGKNCKGPEKLRRIKQEIDVTRFTEIIAYGDSRGDREMLAFANRPHMKPFRH